jgi:hypothetical protein
MFKLRYDQYYGSKLESFLFSILLEDMKKDKALIEAGKKPETLVFKWAPRQQTQFAKKPYMLVSLLSSALFPNEANYSATLAKYRRLLSTGTKSLNTVEHLMCQGKWEDIEPDKVPAKAMKNYRRAFMNVNKKGTERSPNPARRALAEKLSAFLASGKSIHGATLMPHEIIQHFLKKYDPVLEAQLKNLVEEFVSGFPSDIGHILPLSDVSGSMRCSAGSGKATCMDVSIALGFLLSQLPGPFHDKIMTFHENPHIYDLSGAKTLYDKIKIIQGMSWGGNTNFEKAMDQILRSLLDNKVEPSSVSNLTLVVFSDMQFDVASGSPQTRYGRATSKPDWNVAHERIDAMYKSWGFPTPQMVYWNLNAKDSAGHPAHAETKGVSMLSGFSQAVLKSFLSGELVPEDGLLQNEDSSTSETATKTQKDPYEVLCASLVKYTWLMKKFEESGVFPGYLAPIPTLASEEQDLVPVPNSSPAVSPLPVEETIDEWVNVE